MCSNDGLHFRFRAYPSKKLKRDRSLPLLYSLSLLQSEATVIVCHLGNIDGCPALFQIESGGCMKRVYNTGLSKINLINNSCIIVLGQRVNFVVELMAQSICVFYVPSACHGSPQAWICGSVLIRPNYQRFYYWCCCPGFHQPNKTHSWFEHPAILWGICFSSGL